MLRVQENLAKNPMIDPLRDNPDPQVGVNPSQWFKTYWFARMFADLEQSGVISGGRVHVGILATIELMKRHIREWGVDEPISFSRQVIYEFLSRTCNRSSNIGRQLWRFNEDLEYYLVTEHDLRVFVFTCEHLLLSIISALELVPRNLQISAESAVSAIFKSKGEKEGIPYIIKNWERLAAKGRAAAERVELVRLFGELRKYLEPRVTKEEMDIILSAFCQEFERRLGQKRKGRGGRAIEGAASLILKHFGFKTTHAPEHFTTGLEIDRWVKCKDGWLIGISCKRTFRERWKQTYTTDLDLLRRHKIKGLWHLLTYDRDLSDDKITEIGSHRAILYLPDNSERYMEVSKHPGMKDYVRPMTRFVSDLNGEVNS
jgi:hypothetical protein